MPAVRDWMKLRGTVNKPPNEISARPVKGHFLLEFINKSHDLNFYILSSNYEIILSALKGLQYKKGDRSGEHFWGLMQELCGGDAEDFFGNCFVYTYCPLAFYGAGGNDVSLSKLKVKINDCNNKFQ